MDDADTGHDLGHEEQERDYAVRQRGHDADYRREYDRWVNSLPPQERRKLADLGLGTAEAGQKTGSGFRDATESPRCSTGAAELTANDDPQLANPPQPEGEQPHEILRRLIGELMSQDHSRLALDCLALVTGLSYEGDSMTEIAMRHDITRAAVSKRCVELTKALGLSPSRAMRSLAARDACHLSRHLHLHNTDPR
jgi:hypothetical protein